MVSSSLAILVTFVFVFVMVVLARLILDIELMDPSGTPQPQQRDGRNR